MRKRKIFVLSMLLSFLFLASTAWAQIDQLSNMSAEWIRTGNRNAATDSTDIVVYNPAGLTKMSEGVHLNFGNQTLFRSPEHTFDLGLPASDGEMSREQDSPDYFLPNVYGAYNKGPYSFFGGVYIPGNGAVIDYPDGSINTQFIGAMTVMGSGGLFTSFQNDYLKVESTYLASELGMAYECNQQVSLALGVRYLNAQNEIKTGATFIDAAGNPHDYKLRYDTDADGFGAILGVNIAPMDDLNIGLRYESRVHLDFETDLKRNDFPQEFELVNCQEKQRRDLPAMAGIGAEYRFCPEWSAELDFNWYFQEEADWGDASTGQDLSDLAGDCWALGGAFGYQVCDDLLVSIGTIYTKFEWDDMDRYYETIGAFEVLYTDNWYIGTGFAWEFYKDVKLNLAIGQTFWEDADIEYVRAADNGLPPVMVDTENATTIVAFSVDMAY
jgi:long-chain fatty acid transport protein